MQPVADLTINPQRAYAADAPQNVELAQFVDQEGQGEPYVASVVDSPLTFIERGGVPPKMQPVADLTINPQRAYAADAP